MIGRYYFAYCNTCLNPCGGPDDLADTPSEAARIALERGWVQTEKGIVGQFLRCPDCQARAEAGEPR